MISDCSFPLPIPDSPHILNKTLNPTNPDCLSFLPPKKKVVIKVKPTTVSNYLGSGSCSSGSVPIRLVGRLKKRSSLSIHIVCYAFDRVWWL